MKLNLKNVETAIECPGNRCDGYGVTFTQTAEQPPAADADNVLACPYCRYSDTITAARALAMRLLAASLPMMC